MTFSWEAILEGKTFKELGIRESVLGMKVSHQIPKGKKSKSSPHKASITIINTDQNFSGYFRQLDRIKIWLGVDDQMYFQGTFRISKISHTGSETQSPTLVLELVCVSFDSVRRFTSRTLSRGASFSTDIAAMVAEHGWALDLEDIPELEAPFLKTAMQSDWDALNRIAMDLGNLDLYTTFPTTVSYYEEPQMTVVIRKEKYSEVVGPDGKPIGFSFGGDPTTNILIKSYSTSVDVKKESNTKKAGGIDKKGAAEKPEAKEKVDLPLPKDALGGVDRPGTVTLESTGVNTDENSAKTKEQITTGSAGPKEVVKKGGIGSTSKAALEFYVNRTVEHSKKAKLSIETVLPVPFLFPRHQAPVAGIKEFEGVWEIEGVTHSFSGSSFLKTSVSLRKKSAGKTKTDSPKDPAKNTNNQSPQAGDILLPLGKDPVTDTVIGNVRLTDTRKVTQ